ncbi:MAG: DNA translocase FtsK 4TM domain-containing protein [Gammaproteobacteria bacterium]|nr:DNA translocase FtsK 4TM domain-containing protein [Gammaproteobacteria bacterium]
MAAYRVPFREIGLIGIAALALYVFLAVASYSPQDPSFGFSGDSGQVRNWVGRSGAYVSDLVLTLFGLVAYGIPLALALAGLRLLKPPGAAPAWVAVTVRGLGWVGITLCACVLIQLHALPDATLPGGSGGVLGLWFAQAGMPYLGLVGLTLVCLAGLLAGAQAAIGFSWLDVAEATGRHLHGFATAVVGIVDRRLESSRNRRAARKSAQSRVSTRRRKLSRETARRRTRKTPQIEPLPPEPPRQQPLFDGGPGGEMPPMDLLDDDRPDDARGYSNEALEAISRMLELKLKDFGVDAEVVSVLPGPVVTRFEIQPAAGVKVQKISSLAKDLARSLAVISVRIVEIIPGKSVVGIEIPNEHREIVRLKDLLGSEQYESAKSPLSLALGKDIAGAPVLADITRMPHLLIAGTTGSGKSVGVNAMLLSILYKSPPEVVRLILVDPKMLELSSYEGIPHLLTPVVTDMKQAAHALNWCVAEMERRYQLMAAIGVRNLAGFNRKVLEAEKLGKPIPDPLWEAEGDPADEAHPALTALPYIVVVIDEFADMMMIVGKKVEQLIARIAQKARAAGIHLVLATQRPSVDVITGLIKANIPARMSYQVSSKVDSRTVLDQGGAEQLLGYGDMLFLPPGTSVPVRVHGAFVSDGEVNRVASDWRKRGSPDYADDVLLGGDEPFLQIEGNTGSAEHDDPLYDEAVQFVIESRRPSISSVQRKLRIGYNRAARLIEAMEEAGVVSSMNSNGSREVLVPDRR